VCSIEARSVAGNRLLVALQQIYIEHNTLNQLDVNTHNYLKMEVEHNAEYTRGTILNFIFGSTYSIFSSVCQWLWFVFRLACVCCKSPTWKSAAHIYGLLCSFNDIGIYEISQ